MSRLKDLFSALELRRLFRRKLRDFNDECGMEVPDPFPHELEGLHFRLCVLDRVIEDLSMRTDESSPAYPMVLAYSWWAIRAISNKNREKTTKEQPDEESHAQALLEFLIENTRWTDHPRYRSGVLGPIDEFEDQAPLSLEEAEPDLEEDYPDENDDHFGRLIGWI